MSRQADSSAPDFIEGRRRSVEPVPIRLRGGRAGRLTVACVLDAFSFNSFSPEADFAPLTMRDWRAEITAAQPDLLLVESAWRGFKDTWWNTVSRCGPEILGILDWCRERGIPTAFWNKEDPVHFGTFLNLASRFDAVFTTDLDCVPRYKAKLGHERVHFLPFAAQPLHHNPVELFDRIEGCAFAGAYYKKYPHRNRDLDDLATAITELGRFDIYDRNFAKPHPDHTFPERYRSHIVGGLLPEEIDVAYKGYTSNLNLNSVQESQSMFARRVFELVASNTTVISNFARGLRLMFGDLVMTVSGSAEIQRRAAALDAVENGHERLRNQALRKVMAEHTYSERLAYIARMCRLPLDPAAVVVPAIVAHIEDAPALAHVCRMAVHQSHDDWRLILWGEGAEVVSVPGAAVEVVESASAALDAARASGATHVGAWDASSWYGPGYLDDLVGTLAWADVDGVGHVERWSNASGALVRRDGGSAWTMQRAINLGRGIVRIKGLEELPSSFSGLAVSTLDFCEGGTELPLDALEPVSALDLDAGMSLSALRDYADRLHAEPEQVDASLAVPLPELFEGIASRGHVRVARLDDGTFAVESDLETRQHEYLYSRTTLPLDVLPSDDRQVAHFTATPGLNVMLVVVYLDAAQRKLGHTMLSNGKNVALRAPDGTARVRIGLRVSGGGETRIEQYQRAPLQSAPQPLVMRTENLLVTNIYPSYDQLYRNGFVASRVRAYAQEGFEVDVALVDARIDAPRFREFGDVDVATMNAQTLRRTVEGSGIRRVLVHFLDTEVWQALRDADSDAAVTVWIHGFEVQPWYRRSFQHANEDELTAAKERSAERMAMWREVFDAPPAGWQFVFVSDYLAEQTFEDVGVRLPDDRYRVIHNPIDTSLFRFRQKAADDRYRVLSVRPYASNVYANDLAVAAVLRLRQTRPDFERFRFAFYGDGPLFDSVTEPLLGLANVELHKRFLTQLEIAELHRDYGVFLTPSRMDTQGVSRGEAMSSGLVPIASDVAAVPEFVDERSGILVAAEDAEGLAEAMACLVDDPARFEALSRGAAERVAEQVAAERVIAQELSLARRPWPRAAG